MRKKAAMKIESETALFVSTFRAKAGYERMLLHELQRLVRNTRREDECLFCDLYRLSVDPTVFSVHSVWSSRENWLSSGGWKNHPAGLGLLEQCLSEPIAIVTMEEVPEAA
jgi:quinol monooxygenase YgiN